MYALLGYIVSVINYLQPNKEICFLAHTTTAAAALDTVIKLSFPVSLLQVILTHL